MSAARNNSASTPRSSSLMLPTATSGSASPSFTGSLAVTTAGSGVAPLLPSTSHSAFFEFLVENTLCSDVILTTTDRQQMPAHKAVLVAVSPTFRAMFGSAHHVEAGSEAVDVPYHSRSFRVALHYMYTGEVRPFPEPLELLDLSTYYCLDTLKEYAVTVLKQLTTSENTFHMLETALRFHSHALRDHCITLIRQHNTEVIHSSVWTTLPRCVALLLVQETVIESELNILQRCVQWCKVNCGQRESTVGGCGEVDDEGREVLDFRTVLTQFLQFIDFTKMSESEVAEVEALGVVPVEILYRAFKCHCLSLPPPHTPRKGGIILQWEFSTNATDVAFNDNHVYKVSSDYLPRTVFAINRFSKGRHYFTFRIEDFRSPHDCLIGVSCRASQRDYHLEPCCMTICAPPGTVVIAACAPGAPLFQDHRCVVGVLVNFADNEIQWYNHQTKQLLFTARPPLEGGELVMADGMPSPLIEADGGTDSALRQHAAAGSSSASTAFVPSIHATSTKHLPLEFPLVPSVTLYHKSNGGVVLADCTSFLGEKPGITSSSLWNSKSAKVHHPSPTKLPSSSGASGSSHHASSHSTGRRATPH